MATGNDDDSLDIIDGLPVKSAEDEEGPTRSLGAPPDREGDGQDQSPGHGPPSFEILVASEEALRVFDEMSNPGGELSSPGGYHVGFGGQVSEESRVETLPPSRPEEPSTIEITFDDAMPDREGDMPPAASKGASHPLGSDSPAAQREGWLVFEHCPCPLFRLDSVGRIQGANGAFCRFLGAPMDKLRGSSLASTRLGRIDPTLVVQIDECVVSGSALQRIVSFQAGESQVVRFLLWIVPFRVHGGRGQLYSGIILPYPGQGQ